MVTGRPPGSEKYTAQQFIEAIPNSAGIVTTIAARVGCDWHTARKYIDEHPTVKQAYEDERERVLDLAETSLLKSIKDGDLAAVKYYLSTVGKRRGYVERNEVTGAEGRAINLRWDDGDHS